MKREPCVLNAEEIAGLIRSRRLIRSCIHLKTQLTPNGFDLTAAEVYRFASRGELDFSNKERVVSGETRLKPRKKSSKDKFGWWHLKKGAYKIKTNETVNIPANLIAVAAPRSSLLRCGAFTQTAVWDAGFKGRSEFILVVENRLGLRLKQNARVVQLLFLRMNGTAKTYRGIFQGL